MTPGEALAVPMAEGHRMLDMIMSDVTPEMLSWQPPGGVNPIGPIYAHLIGVEDLYVQQIIQGQPLLWATGDWAERLGVAEPPNAWNLTMTVPPDMAALSAYKDAVFANSLAYARGLSGDDLARDMPFPGRAWSMTVAQLVSVVIAHTLSHAGEIAMLKGVQGKKGLPY